MKTFSAHKITKENEFTFCPESYSKFKHGSKKSAKEFGYELATMFIEKEFRHNVPEEQIVVLPSSYKFIPTATYALKNYFVESLNQYLSLNGFNPIEEQRLYRTISYKNDYGKMNAEQRLAAIGQEEFYIDTTFVKDKFLIFLDDIKITGGHEFVLRRMIEQNSMTNNGYFLYFAELVNDNIDPNIENVLNYYKIKTLLDLDKLLKNESCLFNTRVIKFILNYDHTEFTYFIEYQPKIIQEKIFNLAIGNGYHIEPDFSENFNYLRNLLNDERYF